MSDQSTCLHPGCDALVFEATTSSSRECDTHAKDEYGVRYSDCDCYQSWADTAAVYVCGLHRKAFDELEVPTMSERKPIIHVAVEVERNMGDHGRFELRPLTVDPSITLRELVDLAGDRHGGYAGINDPSCFKLGNDRIIVQVEEVTNDE